GTSWPKKRRLIGGKISRLDGAVKSTGRAKYAYDVNRPGLLHGVILRCPYAHAKIKSIDTTPALAMPPLTALITINTQAPATVVKGDPATKAVPLPVRRGGQPVERVVKPGPGVQFLKAGVPVGPNDLKAEDKIAIDVEQDVVGRELSYAGDEIVALCADT